MFYDSCLGLASCHLSTLRRICPPLSFSPSFWTKASHVCHTMSSALKLHLQWTPSSGLVSTGRDISVWYNCNPEGSGVNEGVCLHSDKDWVFERKFHHQKRNTGYSSPRPTIAYGYSGPRPPTTYGYSSPRPPTTYGTEESRRSKSGLGLESIVLVLWMYGLISQVFSNFRVPPEKKMKIPL